MLTSDFIPELGALVRSLEQRVRLHPELKYANDATAVLPELEDAIVALCALHIKLSKLKT